MSSIVNERMRRKASVIEAITETGILTPALEIANVPKNTYFNWINGDPDFRQAAMEAFETACDTLEKVMRDRAIHGSKEVVISKGNVVYHTNPSTGEMLLDDNGNPMPVMKHVHHDKLLETMLRANRSKFRLEQNAAEANLKIVSGVGQREEKSGIEITFVLPSDKTTTDYVRLVDESKVEEGVIVEHEDNSMDNYERRRDEILANKTEGTTKRILPAPDPDDPDDMSFLD